MFISGKKSSAHNLTIYYIILYLHIMMTTFMPCLLITHRCPGTPGDSQANMSGTTMTVLMLDSAGAYLNGASGWLRVASNG